MVTCTPSAAVARIENQPRGVPSLAGMPTTPALCHSRPPTTCVNGTPAWPATTPSASNRSRTAAFSGHGVEAKM
ncbi:MAG: hypothetical protein HYS64_07265 [Rhodospirillales bacterium]|nr:hypothetical protein [Rhodospirillales bacterium]